MVSTGGSASAFCVALLGSTAAVGVASDICEFELAIRVKAAPSPLR